MSHSYTFTAFKSLTEKAKIEQKQSRELTPSVNEKFNIAKDEYCRIIALSEVLNVSKDELISTLLSNALGDAHNGFLSAFSSESERNTHNLQLKQRVKELLLLSSAESSN